MLTQHDAEQPDKHPPGSVWSGSDAIALELQRDALLTLEQLTTSITVLALHSSHHHDFRLNAANSSALRRHEDTATYAEG